MQKQTQDDSEYLFYGVLMFECLKRSCIHVQLIMVCRPLKGTKGNMRKRRAAAGGTCLHVYTYRGDGHWRVGQVCFPAQSWEKPCLA